ncbi:MAG: hypothetical protein Q8N88_02150, partial [Nanoarchaeota archaeon]|nr:hypothetical protein [Nanoarchaeota archaeon]
TPEPNLAPSLPLVYVPVQPEPTEKQESVQSAKPTLPEKCPDKESPPGQNSDAASALNQLAQIPVKNWWPTPADMFVVEDRRYVFPPSGEHSPTTLRIYLKEKASDYRIIIQTSLEGISSQDKTEILNAREMNFPEIPEFLYSREVIEYGGKYYFFLISKTPLIVKR